MRTTIRAEWAQRIGKKAARLALLLCLVAAPAAPVFSAEQAPELAESIRALYQGNYAQAQTLAGEYLKAHPGIPEAWIALARAELAQGKHFEAFRDLRKALQLDPTNTDALYYLGRVAAILSHVEYQELYSLAPHSARVHQLRAKAFQLQHNIPKAEEEYKAALEEDPKSVEVLNALGELERSQYRFEEAVEYYRRAEALAPHDYTSAYGLGACALYQQQPERAAKHFRRALAIDPGSAAAHLALGDALLRANQPATAVEELKKAAKLEPSMRQAYSLLARAFRGLGQAPAAEEALKKERELERAETEERERLLAPAELPPTSPPQSAKPAPSGPGR